MRRGRTRLGIGAALWLALASAGACGTKDRPCEETLTCGKTSGGSAGGSASGGKAGASGGAASGGKAGGTGSGGTEAGSAGEAGDGGGGATGGTAGSGAGGASGKGGSGGKAGGGTSGTTSGPTVVSVTPDDASSGAEPDTAVTIEFSEPLEPNSVSAQNVAILDDTDAEVEGTLAYSGVTATFTPSERLGLLARYTVTVSSAVTDLDGEPMLEDFSSAFSVRDGRWSTPDDLAGGADAGLAHLGADARGNVLVAWTNTTGQFARWRSPDSGWGSTTTLNACTTCYARPRVAVNAAGDAVVAHQQGVRRYVGGGWEANVAALPGVSLDSNLQLRLAPTGEAHLIGTEGADPVALHTDANGDWVSSGGFFTVEDPLLDQLAVAFDEAGNGMAVWPAPFPTHGIRYARYNRTQGTWGTIATIPGSDGGDDSNNGNPGLAVDATGNAVAVWRSFDEVDGHAIKASYFTSAQGWTDAEPIDITPEAPLYDGFPGVVTAGGDFTALWIQLAGATQNVYSNRFVGGAWGTAELRSDGITGATNQRMPLLGGDARGNLQLTWRSSTGGSTERLTHARYTAANDRFSEASDLLDAEIRTADPDDALTVAANGIAALAFTPDGDPPENRRSKVAFFE
jgi:hypothetical protein